MNIDTSGHTVEIMKTVGIAFTTVCSTVIAVSLAKITYRSKALEFYKTEIEALRSQSDIHKVQIQELVAHLEAEKLKSEAMAEEVKILRHRTDYTIVETTITDLTTAVRSNLGELAVSIKAITAAVVDMQAQCVKVHATLKEE
jgi:hypothetical protein